MDILRTALARRRQLVLLGVLALGLVPGALPVSAAVSYPRTAPMVLQNVPIEDLQANRNGICTYARAGRFTHVIKNTSGPLGAKAYLNASAACGLKVIFHFSATVSGGTVYPSRVAYWVGVVKGHPALYGYLSVKEPSWIGINATEIRSLYSAFKKADPYRPVIALFGDVPHFGQSVNPYTAGMADIVMVDWYPVETYNKGCSTSGSVYLGGASTWFPKVRSIVATKTPGRPIWLMVQTHKYLKPTCHKKQRPTQSQLYRQVREGFAYLRARGVAFHVWSNPNYNIDERRDPTMVSWMAGLAAKVRAGTFQ
ncbi:MAG TPA: hypothetical protein VFK38_07960 [Candidatus Limnocylindrales bacterium]|nr:hypothetical protein [Candidatus Limnocylindrales bacterium]